MTIDDVKKELSNDEQMLASAFKLEKLYKKHKLKLFIIIAVTIAYFGGTAIVDKMDMNKREAANTAYLTLEKNNQDDNALKVLEINNPALFELFSYQEAIKNANLNKLKSLTKSSYTIIADLATYHLSILEGTNAISEYHRELAKIHNASLFIQEGKNSEAKEELELISEESPMYNISKMIKHYGIKG